MTERKRKELMATLKQAAEVITEGLRERVDRLVKAVEVGADFGEIARLADAVGELADMVGETYTDLEHALMSGLRGDSPSNGDSRGSRPQQPSEQNGSAAEEATKEELLEDARELKIQGRSSMTKGQLRQALNEWGG